MYGGSVAGGEVICTPFFAVRVQCLIVLRSLSMLNQGHTFLSPAQCQDKTDTAFCEERKDAGEATEPDLMIDRPD